MCVSLNDVELVVERAEALEFFLVSRGGWRPQGRRPSWYGLGEIEPGRSLFPILTDGSGGKCRYRPRNATAVTTRGGCPVSWIFAGKFWEAGNVSCQEQLGVGEAVTLVDEVEEEVIIMVG